MVTNPRWFWKLPPRFVRNTAGLYLETFTSYLFPLVTLPYVVRVLGARGFGLVAFAQSFVSYLNVVVDFALSLSGTREVVQSCRDPQKVGRVVADALALRLGMALGFFPLVLLACHVFAALAEARLVILTLYVTSIATAASASWVFLAFEEMWLLARVNLLINLGVVAAIFALVRSADDVGVYAAILAAGPTAGSLASLILAFRRFSLRPVWPTLAGVLTIARKGWTLCLSQTAIALYTTGNSFLLGTLASKEAVGYFAAADKVLRAVLRLVSPLTTAIFPRMVAAAQRSAEDLGGRARKVLAGYAVMGAVFTAASWITAPWLVPWFFGSAFSPTVAVLRVASLVIFSVACSNVLGLHVLLPAGRDRAFTAITMAAGLGNVLLAFLLVPRLQAVGMAWAVVGSEALVALLTGSCGAATLRHRRPASLR